MPWACLQAVVFAVNAALSGELSSPADAWRLPETQPRTAGGLRAHCAN